jgi:hypothetical protein
MREAMPTYVARIEGESGTLVEHADITVEIIGDGEWRGRFLAPAEVKFKPGTMLDVAFADGRHGRARVDHARRGSAKTPQLVRLAGIGRLS